MRKERPHFLQETGEGGFILKDKVIAARKRHEPGAWDASGEPPALVKRYDGMLRSRVNARTTERVAEWFVSSPERDQNRTNSLAPKIPNVEF